MKLVVDNTCPRCTALQAEVDRLQAQLGETQEALRELEQENTRLETENTRVATAADDADERAAQYEVYSDIVDVVAEMIAELEHHGVADTQRLRELLLDEDRLIPFSGFSRTWVMVDHRRHK